MLLLFQILGVFPIYRRIRIHNQLSRCVAGRDFAYISQQVVEGWCLQRHQRKPGILCVFLFCDNPVPSTDAGRPLQIARTQELEDVKENIVVGFSPAHDFFLKAARGFTVQNCSPQL
jgi:hypothetical protein